MKSNRLYTYILATLCLAQVAVVVMSWIMSALFPDSGIRSMLRGEAIRWFCSHFVKFCSSPALVWLLLSAMAVGTFRASGIFELSCFPKANRRTAIVSSFLVTALFFVIMALLTLVPHAVLLSAVGSLWHSPFSAIAVPFVSFYFFAVSATFGIAVGRFRSFTSIATALTRGISLAAPAIIVFIVASVLFRTVEHVFFDL